MEGFVEFNKEQFSSWLKEFNPTVVENERCKEVIFQIETEKNGVATRIYSTIEESTGISRPIGEDAIRVVFWDYLNDRPIGKGKKILRVEKATSIKDRICSRVASFIKEADDIDIIDNNYLKAILTNFSWNNFASSLLNSLTTWGRLTDKQLDYVIGDVNPRGRDTFEAQLKKKNPEFFQEYINKNSDEDDDNEDQKNIEEGTEKADMVEVGAGDENDASTQTPKEIEVSEIELVPTTGYPYKFEFFNPVQSLVYPHRDNQNNLIVGANTSAGKTICAEILIDETIKIEKKVIYLSPLKSLTQEKYDDWQVRYSDLSICIMTGDYQLSPKKKKEVQKADIIVMTSEMMDSRTRKFKSENNTWMNQVGLVIVDESHILSTERGHAVESGIMRFTSLNKEARIMFLSATMPNVNQLGEWLSKLNGKGTDVVYSTWRPVDLQVNYVEYKIEYTNYGRPDYWATQENKINEALCMVEEKPDEKFLVFVHDKGTGRKILNRLGKMDIESAFHSADLKLDERLEIEKSFQNKNNGIRVLVSTSTLAFGRNLPARNVIICGIHRGISEVDSLDIIQMAGRAGRFGLDDAGFVYLVIPEGDSSRWIEVFKNPRPTISTLNQKEVLAFHILSEIKNRVIVDEFSLLAWYNRSLASMQNMELTFDGGKLILDELIELEMIEGDVCKTTGLGNVSASLYFSPYDISKWYRNFDQIDILKDDGVEINDEILGWAIGDIPSNNLGYIPKDLKDEVMDFKSRLNGIDYSLITDGCMAGLAVYHGLQGNNVNGSLGNIKRSISFDIERIKTALKMIDDFYAGWECDWEILPARVKYGVSEEMVNLTKIKGVGGKTALKMYNAGICTIADVIENKSAMLKLFKPATVKKYQAAAKEVM